ncbi:four helix bundle protein [Candidatus Gottesmanbacteria bacterium]|nr:four helix bundle protein [Candidatus Gottesmanbacteria bacterium]
MIEVKSQNAKVKSTTQNYKSDLKLRVVLYALEVINFCDRLEKNQINRILVDQLIRSSTSIGANIIEAKSSSSRKDFIKFYEFSLKSANEAKYWFYLLRESKRGDFKQINELLQETEEIAKILGSSIITLKGKRF